MPSIDAQATRFVPYGSPAIPWPDCGSRLDLRSGVELVVTGPMQYEEIEAIVRKGEPEERRKRRQFRLRNLLVWTAVAALALGALRTLGLGPVVVASIASWVAIVGGVRWMFGSPVAFVFSIVVGGIAGGGLVLAYILSGGRFTVTYGVPGLLVAAVVGGYAGYGCYVILEVVFCVMGLPDGLLHADSYDRQGPL